MSSKLSVKVNLLQAFEGNVVTLEEAFRKDIMTAKNQKQYIPLEAIKGKKWVCINDLGGEQFFHKTNGDVQLQLDVSEKREVDKYENTHSVSLQQSKATREAGNKKVYCGDGRIFIFGVKAVAGVSVENAEDLIAKANLQKLEEVEDIDFDD